MIVSKFYDRERALEYAREWALSRNPLFFDFTGRGGNCTNFISQSILAGSCVMNPTETFGWYYIDSSDRSPSWTGVQEFYDFITGSGDFPSKLSRTGPFGSEVSRERLEIGDVIQLGNEDGTFYHTLFVCGFENGDVLICAHSDDALDRRLSTYNYAVARYIHIEGINIEVADTQDCFESLISGQSLPPVEVVYTPQVPTPSVPPAPTTPETPAPSVPPTPTAPQSAAPTFLWHKGQNGKI